MGSLRAGRDPPTASARREDRGTPGCGPGSSRREEETVQAPGDEGRVGCRDAAASSELGEAPWPSDQVAGPGGCRATPDASVRRLPRGQAHDGRVRHLVRQRCRAARDGPAERGTGAHGSCRSRLGPEPAGVSLERGGRPCHGLSAGLVSRSLSWPPRSLHLSQPPHRIRRTQLAPSTSGGSASSPLRVIGCG